MAPYTVVIVPLGNCPTSLDALRFFLWVKKLKDVEREKDLLWMGLQALEQVRQTLCSNLGENSSKKQVSPVTAVPLLAQIHRVNRSLRNLLCDSRKYTDPAIEGTGGHQPSPVGSEESARF